MDKRRQDISHFQFNLDKIDKEITMVLQSLQWNRDQLLEGIDLVTCSNDPNHKMPASALEQHELHCNLESWGYSKDETLLPNPIDENASTVKLSHHDIQKITSEGTRAGTLFYMGGEEGSGGAEPEPLSLARLQQRYPAAARRAVHGAVVRAAPAPPLDHTVFTLLTLPSGSGAAGADAGAAGAAAAAAAAQRDLRRRRARYRGPCSRNYSDTLRVLIHSQMEFYSDEQRHKTMHVLNQSKRSTNENVDEVIKMHSKNIGTDLFKESKHITKRHNKTSSKDYKRAKYDAISQDRLREYGKERDYSHTSNQKPPNHSTVDHKEKVNDYSDRNSDEYTERSHNNRYRHYSDEARYNPEIVTSNNWDERHKKLTEKNSLERVQYYERNRNKDLKLGVHYSSKSSAKKVVNRNCNEKHQRSERERTKHRKDS